MLKILAIGFFSSPVVLKRESIETYWIQPCFWLAKSTTGLKTVSFVFLGNEQIYGGGGELHTNILLIYLDVHVGLH